MGHLLELGRCLNLLQAIEELASGVLLEDRLDVEVLPVRESGEIDWGLIYFFLNGLKWGLVKILAACYSLRVQIARFFGIDFVRSKLSGLFALNFDNG